MYQIPEFLKFTKLSHAFSDKKEGNSDFRFGHPKGVVKSRVKFLSKLDINLENCAVLNVQHSDQIVAVDSKLVGRGVNKLTDAIKADCLITDQSNVFLFLLIADCMPLIMYDPVNEAVGLVHAGWKGVDLGIAKKAIKKLGDLYKTDPKNLIVGFGPAARKDSFVKVNPSQKSDPKWESFLKRVEGDNYKVDFVGLCKKQIIDSGVLERNIFDCGIDTVRDKRFFSHVRDGQLPTNQQGRFACVVGLRN